MYIFVYIVRVRVSGGGVGGGRKEEKMSLTSPNFKPHKSDEKSSFHFQNRVELFSSDIFGFRMSDLSDIFFFLTRGSHTNY